MEPDPKLLTMHFDEQLAARGGPPEGDLAPDSALNLVNDVFDDIGASAPAGAGDPAADPVVQALETVRAALSALDTVVVEQPRPRRQSEREPVGLFGLFRPAPPPPPPPPPLSPARLLVRTEQLLDAVRAALEIADRLRAAAAPPPPVKIVRPWAEDPALVRLLHDLAIAARRRTPGFLLARIEQLTDDLEREHEIAVVDYSAEHAGHFQVVESPNPDDREPRTVRPALLYRGAVLRAGEVWIPAPAGPAEEKER